MFKVIDVSGCPGGTSCLVITKESAFLCDTGFSFSARDTAENVRRALANAAAGGASGEVPDGARRLDYILLTHSHFDHAAGTPIVARAFPEAKIVASHHAAEIFARPGARRGIYEMDVAAARNVGRDAGEDTTSELRVDMEVGSGDVIQAPGETIRVYDTPGHTNCSVSYYFENEDLLVTSESSGFKFDDLLCPAFLTSYRDSLESIALVERLAPRYLLPPHAGLISGDEAKAYPAAIRGESEAKADFILSRHRAGMSEEDIVRDLIAEYFDGLIRDTGLQPRESFETNARILVPRLIAEAQTPTP
ncbi:MAG: MBL fold metallo-hydrolase [Clostridiales Family XIII bacterium]|jgi:glyoxylase-like metal-dependent hydrolase (beta-lactamase superfamily II)|nr:MBL fold metallo-hydrolase [Clostridiales Family XIII bacterium]